VIPSLLKMCLMCFFAAPYECAGPPERRLAGVAAQGRGRPRDGLVKDRLAAD
jgi:hypothetical protein